MTDVTQPPYRERAGEQRENQRERDLADARRKIEEQGVREYQPSTSAQFTPEAAGETDRDSEAK